MKTITLLFRSLDKLWDFKQATNTGNFRINSVRFTITASFDAEQIELAVSAYDAIVLEEKLV